jgi:HPt (histidine-containing phosphotransfer) domain-containing protein
MDDTPAVDPAALDRLHGLGGDKLVSQMVRLYLENASERLRQIDSGLAPDGDVSEAASGAHSLKSSAANVGATRVSALSAAMEAVAARGDPAPLLPMREELGEALEEAEARLSELLKERHG